MLVNVFFGGMRSITFVQAFQYWLKLTALLVPVMFLLAVWDGDGAHLAGSAVAVGVARSTPRSAHPLYTTYSIIVATFLGTMGLPHVVVRFYTNPDGRTARRTTLVVLGAARRSSTSCRPCTARSAGSTHRTSSRRAPPTPSCSSCPRGWSAASAASCSRR